MSNELATYDKVIDQMEAITKNYSPMAVTSLSILRQALTISTIKSQLASLMNDKFMNEIILPLKDDELGFLTDEAQIIKNGGVPYSLAVIRNCCIGAIMRGLRITGNEFNIIAGRVYATQNGFGHLVHDFPGLTDLILTSDTPRIVQGGAIVGFTASWNLEGKPMKLERRGEQAIAVKLYQSQGSDVAIGKGTRKMLKSVYQTVAGSRHMVPDGDVDDVELKIVGGSAVELPAPQAKPQQPLPPPPAPNSPPAVPPVTPPATAGTPTAAQSKTEQAKETLRKRGRPAATKTSPDTQPAPAANTAPAQAAPPTTPAAQTKQSYENNPALKGAIDAVLKMFGGDRGKAQLEWIGIVHKVTGKTEAQGYTDEDFHKVQKYAEEQTAKNQPTPSPQAAPLGPPAAQAAQPAAAPVPPPAAAAPVAPPVAPPAQPPAEEIDTDTVTIGCAVQKETAATIDGELLCYIIRSMNSTPYRTKDLPLAKLCQSAYEQKRKVEITYRVVDEKNWVISVKLLDQAAEAGTVQAPLA
jgi:hypothetical protein